MSDNNIAVKITADIVDLQTKFAVAKAEVNGLTSEMNKLAKASAAGTIDAAGTARLKQFAGDLLAARQESARYAGELEKAGFATSTFGRAMENGHGSISTATREFRALFDELSSGRTRQTPGTLAIIAQRVFGLGPAALGAVAGVVGLVGGLALLAYRAIEASKALNQMELGAQFVGNLTLSREALKQFADELSQAKNISASNAREIIGAFASMHDMSAAEVHALSAVVSDFAQVTGLEATKAKDELVKLFSEKESAETFAKSLGGIAQSQINMADSADKSGDAGQVFAAKLEILNSALDRTRGTIDKQNSSVMASFKNYFAYSGLLQAGMTTEQAQNALIQDQNEARARQVQLLQQLSKQIESTPQSRDQTLKTGVAVAEKENPVALQIDAAKAKVGELTAALTIAKERSDQVSVDKLTAGLSKANENLSNLQFGPILERMREQIAQVAVTWDGTQSGMLAKQIQISQGVLADVQQNSKERLAVETEIAHLQVQQRQAVGTELISNARTQIAEINGETSIGGIQRLEAERDIWVQILAGDRVTAAQRREVQRSLNQDIAAINKERQAQSQAIARSDADTDIAIARIKLESQRSALEEEVQTEQISVAQKFAILKDLANREFALNQQALQSELDNLKNQPIEYERVYNQIRELKEKQTLELAKLDRQAAQEAARQAKEQVTAWSSAVGEIESVESRLVTDIIGGRQRLSKSIEQISLELVTKEIANDVKAFTTRMLLDKNEEAQKKALGQGGLLYHLLNEQQKTTATVTGEAARTAAEASGDAARLSSQASAAVAGKAISRQAGSSTVMADAAKAFSGTYASVSQIPYVGWILAPAAAAAAFTAVGAYEGLASLDVGTNYVPRDMVAQLHEGEAVVPRAYNPASQGGEFGGGGGGGGAGGGDIHFHVSAIDAPSFVKWIRQNNGDFADAMKSVHRRFGLS